MKSIMPTRATVGGPASMLVPPDDQADDGLVLGGLAQAVKGVGAARDAFAHALSWVGMACAARTCLAAVFTMIRLREPRP